MKQATDIRETSWARSWILGSLTVAAILAGASVWMGDDRQTPAADRSTAGTGLETAQVDEHVALPRPFPPGVSAVASAQAVVDGAHIVGSASNDGMVRVSIEGEQLISEMAHHGMPVTAFAISNDGHTALSGGGDSELRVWDLRSRAERLNLRGHEHPITAVAISQNAAMYASAAQSTRILLWDAATGKLQASLSGHSDFVIDVAFTGDNRLASAGADGKILMWDLATNSLQRTLSAADAAVSKLAIGADGNTLVSGSDDGTVVIWDTFTGREQHRLVTHRAKISALALNASGTRIATASADNQVAVWNSSTGELLGTFSGPDASVASLSFDMFGNLLIGGSSGSLGQWNIGRLAAL